MKSQLAGTKTLENLRAAFAEECQCSFIYRYLAERAEKEGYAAVASAFREAAEREASHAMGHLRYLGRVELPHFFAGLGYTEENLASAVAAEGYESHDLYPGMASAARAEGFEEIARWFESLAASENEIAKKLLDVLEAIG